MYKFNDTQIWEVDSLNLVAFCNRCVAFGLSFSFVTLETPKKSNERKRGKSTIQQCFSYQCSSMLGSRTRTLILLLTLPARRSVHFATFECLINDVCTRDVKITRNRDILLVKQCSRCLISLLHFSSLRLPFLSAQAGVFRSHIYFGRQFSRSVIHFVSSFVCCTIIIYRL